MRSRHGTHTTWALAAVATFGLLPAAYGAPAKSAPSASIAPAEATTEAALEALIGKLASDQAAVRESAAAAIALTPPEALPMLATRLQRLDAGPGPLWLALDAARKSAGDDGDLLPHVLRASPTPGQRSLALLLATLKACEASHGVVGARVLVALAVEHKGLLKREATAALKRMGDHAVAALIEARPSTDKDLRSFASKLLDALGKFLPSDAVQVSDPQDLADVLTAYGKVKDPDSLRAIVAYLNADRAPVRDAARWAMGQFGDDAKPVLKDAYEAFKGDKLPDAWTSKQMLDALLTAYDKVRLADVFRLFDEGAAARNSGQLADAVAAYDALLARAPTFERRSELAPAYYDLGKATEGKDRPAARALLAKAARLAQGTPFLRTIEAEVHYLDALEQTERGLADTTLLERAIQLDPSHSRARDLLARIEEESRANDTTLRRLALSAAIGLLAAIVAILTLGRRTPRPAKAA